MDTKTRAEKITDFIHQWEGWNARYHQPQFGRLVDFINSQLDEAVAEAVTDMSKSANILLESAHAEGFAAARDQAAGIVKEGSRHLYVDEIAERIRAMEVGNGEEK